MRTNGIEPSANGVDQSRLEIARTFLDGVAPLIPAPKLPATSQLRKSEDRNLFAGSSEERAPEPSAKRQPRWSGAYFFISK
jgi:hypothetical protein